MEDYQTALQTWLRGGANDDATSRFTAILYWLNGNSSSAFRYFETLMKLNPNYSIKELERRHNVWSDSDKIKSIETKAFKELSEAYENSKK